MEKEQCRIFSVSKFFSLQTYRSLLRQTLAVLCDRQMLSGKIRTHPQKHSVKRRTVNKICKIILVPRMSVPKNIDSYRLQSPSHFLSSLSINYFNDIIKRKKRKEEENPLF